MSNVILVTGFDRFGPYKRANPSSEVILPALDAERPDITKTLILPTVFDEAAHELHSAVKYISPAAIVMFGVAGSIDYVRLEKQGKNSRVSPIPDNKGQFKFGRITANGPRSLDSTLPLQDIHGELQEQDIKAKFSRSAGRFVCNDLFYQTLLAEQAGHDLPPVPTGFVHIGTGQSDETLQRAAVTIIDTVHSHVASLAK